MKNIILFIILFIFTGCPKINGIPKAKDWADGAIGMNYYESIKSEKNKSGDPYVQNWRDKRINKDYYLTNGNLIHVHPIRRDCLIHWEIDKDTNKIIGYKFEGNRCY
jgi:hypothetical protein